MEELKNRIQLLGWKIYEYGTDWELTKYSPAGEDFGFAIQHNNSIEQAKKEIEEYALYFDEDEHAKMWANARDMGQPSTLRELVEDAEAIHNMLLELSNAITAKQNILILEKMGCDFWKDDQRTKNSDLQNFRLRTYYQIKDNDNLKLEGDFSFGYLCKTGEEFISCDLQYNNENGFACGYNKIYDFNNGYKYNKKDLLLLVNKISQNKFTDILITKNGWRNLKSNTGYREKEILNNLQQVIKIEEVPENYNIYRFIDTNNNYFDYDIENNRIVG